ncbi:MAG TPA: aminoglycoside phosphotransferase family protein, partial [Allocoleopsis sp.]
IKNRYDRGFSKLHPAISCELYNSAFGVAATLSSIARWSLVHGDLKPKNVLERDDGSYVAIDPDAAIGHFAYDAATWAIDKPAQAINRTIEIADHLKISPRVIGSWILVLAIPEICLVSEERANLNLELIKELAETSNLEQYYANNLIFDIHFAASS